MAIASRVAVTKEELKQRTKAFGIATVKFVRTLPSDPITAHFALQLAKSATSVGANYRSSCRAKSAPDFVSKMTVVEEESDEAMYWLEVLVDTDTVSKESVAALIDEADALVRITVASIKTARGSSR